MDHGALTVPRLRVRAGFGVVRSRVPLGAREHGATPGSGPPSNRDGPMNRRFPQPQRRLSARRSSALEGLRLASCVTYGCGARRLRGVRVVAHSGPHGHSHDNKGGRPSFTDDEEGDSHGGHSHSHGSSGGCCGAPYGCGGTDAASMSMDPSGSYDEEAFIAEAGVGDGADAMPEGARLNSSSFTPRGPNAIENALTAFYRTTRLGWIADRLKGNVAVCAIAWVCLIVGGIAHLCRNMGMESPTSISIETAATAAVYALAGTSEFVDVSYELAVGNVNIHVLTTLAVAGTVLLGCAIEGAMLLVLFASAHFVEDRLTGHARGDLRSLWATVPGEATIVELNEDGSPDGGSERLVPARDVGVGTNVFVRAGQQVPLDGVVVHGSALVSIQHITGEALPVLKRVGDEVPAGAVNSDGALVVKSIRSSEDSTPARIARLTEAAQNRRPAVTMMLDRVGDTYSKAILAVTALTMVVGPLVLGWPFLGRGGAMYRAFAFLSAAAPCALLMAPLVYVAAIGACARRGVLVRGGVTFDALAECGTVALDKTGTITSGRMTCVSIERVSGGGKGSMETGAGGGAGGRIPAYVGALNAEDDVEAEPSTEGSKSVAVAERDSASSKNGGAMSTTRTTIALESPAALAIAASLERGATHPIARAVLDTASDFGLSNVLPDVAVSNFRVVAGCGVEGLVRPAVVGNDAEGACGPARLARFGNVDWACEILGDSDRVSAMKRRVQGDEVNSENAVAALVVEDPGGDKNGSAGTRTAADADTPCDVDTAAANREWSSENLACVFRFADSLHPKAKESVDSLRDGSWRGGDGMDVLMLTGDNELSANAIADAVGLPRDKVSAGLTPGDKLRIVESARKAAKGDASKKYKKVAMVGDGINDAPALAAADVGVAVASTPSEAAAAAADVLLLHADSDGISQLPELFDLAARTKTVLRQNITLACMSIVGASLPALVGAFPLWLAVLLHEGSTLLVAINSVRLLGTFGRQPLRRSTVLACFGVFLACCAGGAWLYPTVRAGVTVWATSAVATPAFIAASMAFKSGYAGLLAGCLHTLTGPDHLAALTPLAVGPSRMQNALMGALWGLGHNTGQILFGLIFILLRDKLPFNMEIISQWGQGIVGATLVIIGVMGWLEGRAMAEGRGHAHSHSHGLPFGLGNFDQHTHSHSHSHDEHDPTAALRYVHSHAGGAEMHSHDEDDCDVHEDGHGHSHAHSHAHEDGHHGMGTNKRDVDGDWEADDAVVGSGDTDAAQRAREEGSAEKKGSFLSWTYITGTIHGLQPDSLLLLLPAFALPRLQAIAFLGTFFIGTVVAMGTYTACLGAGTAALQKSNPRAVSAVSVISSGVAVAIGVAFILSAIFGFEIF